MRRWASLRHCTPSPQSGRALPEPGSPCTRLGMDLPLNDTEVVRLEAADAPVSRLAREVRRLRQALRRYAIHEEDCALEAPHDEDRPPDCTCGLDEAIGAV